MRVPTLVRAYCAHAVIVAAAVTLNGMPALSAQQAAPRRAPAQQAPQSSKRPPATTARKPAAPVKVLTQAEQHMQAVETGLVPSVRVKGKALGGMTLAARMKKYKVPAVSIVVIHDYAIEWAKAYGVADASGTVAVDSATAFQAGPAGELVAAFAALRLAQNRKLKLDEDINKSLKIWKLPKSDFTKKNPVTARSLMTHSAGLVARPVAAYEASATLPTITQVLFGTPPAKTAAVVSVEAPGEGIRSSATNFAVVQQLVEDISKRPFSSYAADSVLEPLGMHRSGFFQPPSETFAERAASGHDAAGKPLAGKWPIYANLASAGLWSTPTDLAQLVLEIQVVSGGRPGKVLTPEYAMNMLVPEHVGWPGLGVALEGREAGARFRVGGTTMGYQTEVVGFVERGQGAVVMVNSADAGPLVDEILNAIATVYQWPGYVPAEKLVAKVDPKVFDRFVGRYTVDSREVSVIKKTNKLFIGPAGKETVELMPESVSDFFTAEPAAIYSFVFDEGGKVQAFTQRERNNSSRWDRKN